MLRFQALLHRVEGRPIVWMPRSDWSAFQGEFGTPVEIDVSGTPLAGVSSKASVVAAIATPSSGLTAQIDLYRYDPKDHPTPINKDTYVVHQDILGRPDYTDLVRRSSTTDDENLRGFLRENVALVKAAPGPDHWLPEVPTLIPTLAQSSSRSS